MKNIFIYFLSSFLFLESIYHISSFGFSVMDPFFIVGCTLVVSAIETLLVSLGKEKRVNKIIFWIISVVNYFVFASQIVYYCIFKKPLLIEAAINTGAAALTDFWKVAVDGIIKSIPWLLLLSIPMVIAGILFYKKRLDVQRVNKLQGVVLASCTLIGISFSALLLVIGYSTKAEEYDAYQEMYDPEIVAQKFGVLPLMERQLLGDLLPETKIDLAVINPMPMGTENVTEQGTEGMEEPTFDTSPNVLNIDMDALLSNSDEDIQELATIMQAITPSNKNEYTGMFEGYNLIYLTAEAFTPYAVSEELTPTLYKMIHEGVVVEDYYVPLWATSTSDGEYVNLTGQIPDEQYSMKRTQYNAQPYSLPAYFAAEGAKSFGYHNNTLSYYDRHLTHPNLGYDFKAARLGSCSASTYGDQIFEMEGANYWPASDYEMMVATIPEWINEDRFHAYYMTVSGHSIYTKEGNMMASKNWDVVKDLDCSEEMKGYIASNYELEKAMTYLVEELEKAGKLDNTVIALSADHHPYGIEDSVIEEFIGRDLEKFERYKNCVIIWNNQMEPIQVDKTCSSLDLLPTLLNLFGFEYDSRLFPGKDMLSDAPSLVVLSNRSFITDSMIYDASEGTVISRTEEEISEEDLQNMKDYVKIMFQYSAGILDDDFFRYVDEANLGNTSTQG